MDKTFNVLMYSHDTYGLGHIRRTMAIASQLKCKGVNILILTGSPIVGRFEFPEQIDFVRIPGMIKKSNDIYVPHSIKIDPVHAMSIRQSIIDATAKSFQPDLFIVDKAPRGLKHEIMPTLQWMKQSGKTRTILGLRDIMDDAESTIRDWTEKGIYDVLDNLYSEIWVYGHQNYYDPIKEYKIPESISKKMVFTGYIPRKVHSRTSPEKRKNGKKLVVITAGGGGDGYPMMDAYLKALEKYGPQNFRTVMVTGPFMSKDQRLDLSARAKKLSVTFYHFYRRMEKLFSNADLVVCMGGYNTFCEILSHKQVALIVPRETPRLEQTIRAKVLKEQNLADYIPWHQLGPDMIMEKIDNLLNNSKSIKDAIQNFKFTGLDVMHQRVGHFKENCK
ncbi:glycosyltransferase family protein [Maridesulfovibrio hydrothermalis]|uniref:Glycosyltransferase 28 domain protein n=1 Tax=Maridesulfovibrio hydrothermalis AM13 = DSM 14728 TaxID=1121451 RepID=L0RER0_9BACT|nr:glycosyltransferase [Maridesulfovibrio hydrothermalis]CCO24697.1 Glycosyltransferase 28 domain protein [Maridesulfovibrio hydrothermalis AM13 = DSM 14728]